MHEKSDKTIIGVSSSVEDEDGSELCRNIAWYLSRRFTGNACSAELSPLKHNDDKSFPRNVEELESTWNHSSRFLDNTFLDDH